MPAFSASLRTSRGLLGVCVLLHVAMMILVGCLFAGWLAWLAVSALLIACIWAVRGVSLRGQHAITAVMVDAQGRAALLLRHNSLMTPAQLQGDSRVGRWLIVLHWRSTEGSYWQVVLPDMTDAQSFRRLKVWARWCQDEQPAPPADGQDWAAPA